MKRFPQGELRFDEKELKRDLGSGNIIFVGSSCDMFANDISDDCINRVLLHCNTYPKNNYLFQSKNPVRMMDFPFPFGVMLATTIETNRDYKISKAPPVLERASAISQMASTVVTIEPILDFDLEELVALIELANPESVNIGADSKGHNLPEPSWDKVQELISALKEFTEVKIKSNLERLKK
jgi:protein gp37